MFSNDEDKTTLEYLQKFQPRKAPPLNLRHPTAAIARKFALVGAVVALAIIALIGLRPTPERLGTTSKAATSTSAPAAVTLMQLNTLMRRGDTLDAALSRSARETLPLTNRPNTALHALAKE